MPSTYSTNKNFELPASGSYNNSWAGPVNADFSAIDNAFGGLTTINVTGVTAGAYALSIGQYQPPNIVFTGTISAALLYTIPSGVGGVWTIYNATTGGYNLGFAVSGGGTILLGPGRSFVVSNGTNVTYAGTLISGSFTGTFNGFTTAQSATCNYTITGGGVCTLEFCSTGPQVIGTSNTATMTMTGVPQAACPARSNLVGFAFGYYNGNSFLTSVPVYAYSYAASSSGLIQFWGPNTSLSPTGYAQNYWNSTGYKGIGGGVVVYSVI